MIRETINAYLKDEPKISLYTMRCFVGMLQTGEATVADFVACGVDLYALANQYGSANCWTGTSGTVAAQLRKELASANSI